MAEEKSGAHKVVVPCQHEIKIARTTDGDVVLTQYDPEDGHDHAILIAAAHVPAFLQAVDSFVRGDAS